MSGPRKPPALTKAQRAKLKYADLRIGTDIGGGVVVAALSRDEDGRVHAQYNTGWVELRGAGDKVHAGRITR
jgi:hypothetical protein